MNSRRLASVVGVLLCLTAWLGAGPATAEGSVSATATIDGRNIAGATASDPVRLEPSKVTLVVVEVENESAAEVKVRRVDLAGHVLGLNFFSYSTSVELAIAAGKTEKLTYRLDPAGLDGQATGLIGSDLTVIGADGEPVAEVHTVIDVRGSLGSVYGLFGIILAILTALAIADAALNVARHRLSANRWQRGLRLLAPGVGIGLMTGFTASVARWWVPGTAFWLALAGITATVFFLAGYLSPTPQHSDDLGLDPEDLAAARELDAQGFTASNAEGQTPAHGARGGVYAGVPAAPYGGANTHPGAPDPGYDPVTYNMGGQGRPSTVPQHIPVGRDQSHGAGPAPTPGRGFGWRAPVVGTSESETTIGRSPDLRKPIGAQAQPAGDDAETRGWESGTVRKVDPHVDEPTIRDRSGGTQRFRPGGTPT